MLRDLDWESSLLEMNLQEHFRLLLCVVVGGFAATLILNWFFPHTFWIAKLWSGFAIGATVGMFPGTWWQLSDNRRRPKTCGWFVVIGIFGWGFFAVISVARIVPDLRAQETELARFRSLAVADISSISVRSYGKDAQRIQDISQIGSFVRHSRQAKLFYPGHEGSADEFRIVIHRSDGTSLEYDGCVPEQHQSDFSLQFRGYYALNEIIFPGGRVWLDSLSDHYAR